MKHRHTHHLIGIVDTAVDGIVREPKVAVGNPRIVRIIVNDVLDDQRRNDGVQIGTTGPIHEIPRGRHNADQRVAGDAHGAAARAHEHLHTLIENVVGALKTNLVLAQPYLCDAIHLFLTGRGWFEPGHFLFGRRYRHN